MLKPLFIGVITTLFLNLHSSSAGIFPKSDPQAGVASTNRGMWSIFANPAGLTDSSHLSAGIYYRSAFTLKELSESGVALSIPISKTTYAGIGYNRFGYNLYKHEHIAVGLARRFGNAVNAGVSFDILMLSVAENYGKAAAVTATAGIQVKLTDEIRIGISVFNPGKTKISRNTNTAYPIIFQSGMAVDFGKHAELSFGVDKADADNLIFTGVFSYVLSNKFKMKAGASNGTDAYFFGYSFQFGNYQVSMYSGYHHLLGFSPSINLIYKK